MGTRLFVGNLDFATGEDSLRDAFAEFGEVVSATVVVDRMTGRSRGFGFVEYNSEEDAQRAIQSLDGKQLDGRSISVNVARERNAGGGGGRGFGDGGGRQGGGRRDGGGGRRDGGGRKGGGGGKRW